VEVQSKAKVLLVDGSFIDYIERVLGENGIVDFTIIEKFNSIMDEQIKERDDWCIRSNWDERAHEFIADGYSRRDIEFDDVADLEEYLTPTIILEIAQEYIKKYFDNDMDLLDDMEIYVKSCQ